MKVSKKLCGLTVLTLLAVGCGSKSDSSSGNSSIVLNGLTESFSQVSESTEALSELSPSGANSFESDRFLELLASPTWWTHTSAAPDDSTDANDNTSLKEWMGQQIDENAVRANGSSISILGRLKDSLGVFCALGVAMGNVGGNGYPADGTSSVTITSAMVSQISSQCDFDASQATNSTISFTTTTPNNTTVYDKYVTLTTPQGGNQTVYFRVTSTEVNVGSIETYTVDDLPKVSRTIVQIKDGVMRGEFMSGPTTSFDSETNIEFSRMMHDQTNDKGYIMSMNASKDLSTVDYTQFILNGKPNTTSAKLNLSIQSTWMKDASNNQWAGTERKICVDPTNGEQATGATDNTFCSADATTLTGLSVQDNSVFSALRSGYSGSNYSSISLTTALSFNEANFNTTSF